MNPQPAIVSMILYLSKFSVNCELVYKSLPSGVLVIWLDTPEEREFAKRGKSYQITQVPSLVVQKSDGALSVYVGAQKILTIFSRMTAPPEPPQPQQYYQEPEIIEEEPEEPPPKKVYQPEIEEPPPKKAPKAKKAKKVAPIPQPEEELEIEEIQEVQAPKSFRAKSKSLRSKSRAKAPAKNKSIHELAKEMESQSREQGMEF